MMSGQSLAGWGIFFLFGIVLPVAACFLHKRYPAWFRSWQILLWVCGSAIFSWGFVTAILVPCYFGQYVPRGPEVAFALFFGWLYLWAGEYVQKTLGRR